MLSLVQYIKRNNIISKIIAGFIVALLLISNIFILSPTVLAAEIESKESISAAAKPGTGAFFLQANAPKNLYDTLCLTITDLRTNKDFTLKIDGGGAFEVNVSFPVGEYQIKDAYLRYSDLYDISYNEESFKIKEGETTNIDVELFLKDEIIVSSEGTVTPETPEKTDETENVQPDESLDSSSVSEEEVSNSSDVDVSVVLPEEPDEENNEPEEDPELSEDTSNDFLKTLWNIAYIAIATLVFCIIVCVAVFFIRKHFED